MNYEEISTEAVETINESESLPSDTEDLLKPYLESIEELESINESLESHNEELTSQLEVATDIREQNIDSLGIEKLLLFVILFFICFNVIHNCFARMRQIGG